MEKTLAADDTSGDSNCPEHLRITCIHKKYGPDGSIIFLKGGAIPKRNKIPAERRKERKGHRSYIYRIAGRGVDMEMKGQGSLAEFLCISITTVKKILGEAGGQHLEYNGYTIDLLAK